MVNLAVDIFGYDISFVSKHIYPRLHLYALIWYIYGIKNYFTVQDNIKYISSIKNSETVQTWLSLSFCFIHRSSLPIYIIHIQLYQVVTILFKLNN